MKLVSFSPGKTHRARSRRGAAALAVILGMLLMQLAIVAMVVGASRRHDLAGTRINSMRSFYAAEAGINMGVRELMNNTDEDQDGTVGAVSDDGNAITDPQTGQGTSFVVSKIVNGNQVTLRSVATANSTVRFVEITLIFE
ncbi:MAG: hypothetical protein AB7G11_02220 [Phycisphaerales bacterium]